MDEISVVIDRNGRMLFTSLTGNHRLAIVKILNLQFVPVCVVGRHSDARLPLFYRLNAHHLIAAK
jgi:hypothetical protein